VQYLLIFPTLLCVFGGVAYIIFYGTKHAFLASVIIILFSYNIAASLCYYNVDCFMHVIVILRYDCKLALNIVVKKLSMVGIYNP